MLFSETSDQADWGYWYYATNAVSGMTYQSGEDTSVRGSFTSNGKLPDTQDTNYRAINDDYPVFGFAIELGTVGTTAVSTLFSLGITQEEAIQFTGASGTVAVPSLWTSYFSSETAAVSISTPRPHSIV